MGTTTDAILAYGYDLGGSDGWAIREIDEYDSLDPAKFAWYDDENDDDFQEQAERHLLASEVLGVQFETYCSDSAPMHLLAAKVITVRRGNCEVLDLPALSAMPAEHGWDDKLRAACQALGITPTQASPGWVLVSYWG